MTKKKKKHKNNTYNTVPHKKREVSLDGAEELRNTVTLNAL